MAANPTIVMYFIWIKLLRKQILYHFLILEFQRRYDSRALCQLFQDKASPGVATHLVEGVRI